MQYRLLTLIFLILLTASCAGSMIEHEVRHPDGQPFPDPYYVGQTIDQKQPIRVSFFYSSIQFVEDLDQTKVRTQKFLDRTEHYFFSKSAEDELQIIVRVLNPRNVKYKLYCRQTIDFSDGGHVDQYSHIAYSDMKYREYAQNLPTWDGVKEVTYSLELTDPSDNLLISTGKFHYYVSQ